MEKKWSLLMIPAIAVIIVTIFSSFTGQTSEIDVEELLRERTRIIQGCLYGQIARETAEKQLLEIETYPLVSKDIASLVTNEETEVDVVNNMNFIDVVQNRDFLAYKTYNIAISWDMTGLSEQYVMRGDYYVVLKNDGSGYKLSKFDAL